MVSRTPAPYRCQAGELWWNGWRWNSSFAWRRVDNQIAVLPLHLLGVEPAIRRTPMFGSLINVVQRGDRAPRTAVAKPHWRPAVEALECRIAPSLTPIFECPVTAMVQSPLPLAVRAAELVTASSAVVSVTAPSTPTSAAPLQAGDRAEFFASTFGRSEAAQPASIALGRGDAAPVRQVHVAAPPHAGQPLLVWVLGMTCMLMLSWERHLRRPTLRNRVARRTRWAKSLADLSTAFAGVWRPRARSACA